MMLLKVLKLFRKKENHIGQEVKRELCQEVFI
jgi:hypothetical protein